MGKTLDQGAQLLFDNRIVVALPHSSPFPLFVSPADFPNAALLGVDRLPYPEVWEVAA